MFELYNGDAMDARSEAMGSCMRELRAAHEAYTDKSDESLDMHAALSRYKYVNNVLFTICNMRVASFDELQDWMHLGHFTDPAARHVELCIEYHYKKAVEHVDSFLQTALSGLESLEMASVEMEVRRAHDVFKERVERIAADAALSVDVFCDRHSIPSSLDLAALVGGKTPSLSVCALFDRSKAAFRAHWNTQMVESEATTLVQEARLRAVDCRLLALKTAASMWTYRRGVLRVIFEFQDAQFSELKTFVDKVCDDHGVFADGTGSHIQAFLQNELVAMNDCVGKKVNCNLTMDKWAAETIEIEDQQGAEVAWLDASRTVSGARPFHVIIRGDVGRGTAFFRSNVTKAAPDFGLSNDQFREKYFATY